MWCKRCVKVIATVLAVMGIFVQLSTYTVLAKAETKEIVETVESTCETEAKVVVAAQYIEKDLTCVQENSEEPEEKDVEEVVVETKCYACTLSEAQSSATKAVNEDDPQAISFVEELDDGTRIYSFKGGTYTIPATLLERDAMTSENGYVEKITEVPHYIQQSYPYTKYGGHGTVSSHGCGITSCAMVYSYLLDYEIRPDELAEKYGRYNTAVGSAYSLFSDSASDFNLEVKMSYSWQEVEEALRDGCVVIANVRSDTIFTQGGHYIVYYGITEDGKILINDPNIYNYGEWSHTALKEGFKNGFDPKYCKYSFPCWIYSPKDINAFT